MPVSVPTIKSAVLAALDQAAAATQNPQQSRDNLAQFLAQAIADAILSAEVMPGIPVATTGSASAQTGQTTSSGKLQ